MSRSALDRQRLLDFLAELAWCTDEGAFDRIPQFFAENAFYLVIPRREHDLGRQAGFMRCESRGMIEDRLNAMQNGNIFEPHQYRHILGPSLVHHAEGGLTRVRTPFLLVRTAQEGLADVFATGKYLDEIAERDQRLEIRSRIAVLDSHRIDTLIVLPI